ncbi:hypothetical protein Trydic_g10387 [Trypoxylus dichotomus]
MDVFSFRPLAESIAVPYAGVQKIRRTDKREKYDNKLVLKESTMAPTGTEAEIIWMISRNAGKEARQTIENAIFFQSCSGIYW